MQHHASQTMFVRKLPLPTYPLSRWLEICSLLGLVIGVVMRLGLYFSNRSLWFDEAALVLNLMERGYLDLLNALTYNQAAPPLFLWIEKFALETWGNSEYALRLFPLLGGLLSLIACYRFTQSFTQGWARPITMLLLGTLEYLVYFAAEIKPYSWDMALGLLLFMTVASLNTLRPRLSQLLTAGSLGIVGIWLSYPSIFIIAGVEAANLVKLSLWKSSWSELRAFLLRRLPLYAGWIASFSGLYFGIIRNTLAETSLAENWAARYPSGWYDLLWLVDSFGRFFHRPLGFVAITDAVAMVAFVTGCIHLYRTNRLRLIYLSGPFAVTLCAAYLHQYPFRDRLILFLVPFGLAILADGIVFWLRQWHKRPQALKMISAVVAVGLLVMPLGQALNNFIRPTRLHFDHVRPAIAYIDNHWQPGNKLHVFTSADLQFHYYFSRFDLPMADTMMNQLSDVELNDLEAGNLEQYQQALTALKADQLDRKRIWIVLAARKHPDSEAAIIQWLKQLGKPLETVKYPDVRVRLYDFS